MAIATAAETLDWSPATAKVESNLVHCFQPLTDARWDAFLQAHPNASVFHSSPWLKALNKTYGYEVVGYTTSDTQELENGLVFCRVNSWLTGPRLVSLPFSDHCEPLISSENAATIVAEILSQEFNRDRRAYVEVRPLEAFELVNQRQRTRIPYVFHQLDLTPDVDVIFRKFHKSSIQRKIRKAETEKLVYGEGTTDALLDQFYALFKQTRKRHRIPPPPRQWFVNLMRTFGDALKIRVAYKNDRAVAAMITLRYKDTLVYKYGASEPEFHRFGAMHLLYWKAIQESKRIGLRKFDFGRTDADQQGLITFKSRWGAKHSSLTYLRYSVSGSSTHFFDLPTTKWKSRVAKYAVSHLPYSLVSRVGQLLYPHIA